MARSDTMTVGSWEFSLRSVVLSSLSVFMWGLLFGAFVWVFCFKVMLTRRVIRAFLRQIGVGLKKAERTFVELRRKSFHVAGVIIPMIYFVGLKYTAWMDQRLAILLLGVVTAFLWVVELLRLISDDFRTAYNRVFGSMLRKSELSQKKKLTGTGFFFLGNFLCVYLFHPVVAIAGILFLVLGDLAAALVGISFGKTKVYGKKSLEGTLACFCTCFVIGVALFWHVDFWEYVVMAGALTAALVELFNPDGLDDNVTIPVMSSLALHLALQRCGSPALHFP